MDTIADRPDTVSTTASAERRRRKATRASGPPGEPGPAVVLIETGSEPEEPIGPRRRIPAVVRRIRLGRTGLRRTAAALAIVALLASVSVAGVAWHDHRRAADDADRATAIVDVARQGVTALINIRGDQADADFARLGEITAPPFSDELHDQSKNYLQAVRDAKVASTGQVVAAGIAAAGDDIGSAVPDAGATTVIVAADAQVTNPETHQPEHRAYRFSVKVKDIGGALKVTDVEFVP
ncbi:hypothetical protein NONO_c32820 [Nocardia nova SH22a]|uniref:Mce-associated membrane protein n=1 Tax=Nocardia nova SH22a TaxID=1415166 RepID=W5TFX9_9NOCA|nr:hypothetical protein [Nocardia nova]AHH18069.1 hypothetical protein NONO_c32820 [Nocardia nova SH22a]